MNPNTTGWAYLSQMDTQYVRIAGNPTGTLNYASRLLDEIAVGKRVLPPSPPGTKTKGVPNDSDDTSKSSRS